MNIFQKKMANSSKYTEDWIPVKDISNGCIILDNGYKVTGVKITPRNIFILDPNSQENVIVGLKTFYNTLDFEFWIMAADRPVDIAGYMAQLQLLKDSTSNPVLKKMINQDIDKANMFIDNNVSDTEYYLLFKEKGKNNDILQKKLRTVISGLANCGLNAMQTTNNDLRVLLNNFLNGGMDTKSGTVIVP
ncbi:MAG: hypothetical protein Q4G04_03370 [bacterium]|nr:hypothetical protein [bacterium]